MVQVQLIPSALHCYSNQLILPTHLLQLTQTLCLSLGPSNPLPNLPVLESGHGCPVCQWNKVQSSERL